MPKKSLKPKKEITKEKKPRAPRKLRVETPSVVDVPVIAEQQATTSKVSAEPINTSLFKKIWAMILKWWRNRWA